MKEPNQINLFCSLMKGFLNSRVPMWLDFVDFLGIYFNVYLKLAIIAELFVLKLQKTICYIVKANSFYN